MGDTHTQRRLYTRSRNAVVEATPGPGAHAIFTSTPAHSLVEHCGISIRWHENTRPDRPDRPDNTENDPAHSLLYID